MASLNPARRNAILLIVLLIAQLLLMTSNARRPNGTTVLEHAVVTVSWPVVSLFSGVAGGYDGLVDGFHELRHAKVENERLRDELGRLRTQLDRYEEQAIENERLTRLLAMKQHLMPEAIGARVLTATLSDQEHVMVIDQGTRHGVRADLAVVGWGGAVGRVISASPFTARVRLVSDPNAGVAGVIQRSRQGGMVYGRGEQLLEMTYVPSYADVRLADRIVTSGLDDVFPPGIGIGRVTYLSDASGIAKTILVEPEVDFGSLEEVLVLQPLVGPVPEETDMGAER
jgi:rod shape-determining protein MreC